MKPLFVGNLQVIFMADNIEDAMNQLAAHSKNMTDGQRLIEIKRIQIHSYATELQDQKSNSQQD